MCFEYVFSFIISKKLLTVLIYFPINQYDFLISHLRFLYKKIILKYQLPYNNLI